MKLLLIEDNDQLRKSVVEYLRDEDFTVDSAEDGFEGLYKIINWDYDLIVLDVMLPGRDGWDILGKLRDMGLRTPVIMLTARDQLDDRLKGLNHGADDYMTKPFEMDELVARIRAVVRRAGGTPNPRLTLDDVTLNTSQRTAFVGDSQIELSGREFSLLEILMTRHDQLVTRDFLHGRLFDENDESYSNMLDVYIYRLRQKLGRDRIQTRRGLGYMFCTKADPHTAEVSNGSSLSPAD